VTDGVLLGKRLGSIEGYVEGSFDGRPDGLEEGLYVGVADGRIERVGLLEGLYFLDGLDVVVG